MNAALPDMAFLVRGRLGLDSELASERASEGAAFHLHKVHVCCAISDWVTSNGAVRCSVDKREGVISC